MLLVRFRRSFRCNKYYTSTSLHAQHRNSLAFIEYVHGLFEQSRRRHPSAQYVRVRLVGIGLKSCAARDSWLNNVRRSQNTTRKSSDTEPVNCMCVRTPPHHTHNAQSITSHDHICGLLCVFTNLLSHTAHNARPRRCRCASSSGKY